MDTAIDDNKLILITGTTDDDIYNIKENMIRCGYGPASIENRDDILSARPINRSTKWNVGAIGGKFRVVHQAHKELAIQAMSRCSFVHVFITENPEYNRPTNTLEVKKAFGAIFQNANFKNFKIHIVPDLDGIAWDMMLINLVPDLQVIFNSKESYDKYLLFKEFVELSSAKEVSASSIETETYNRKNFVLLADEFKPYMNKKVVITGIESTGKTTMTQKLASVYNTNYSEEYGRYHLERYLGGIEDAYSPADFVHICMTQILQDKNKNLTAERLLLVDTDPIVTLYYMRLYHRDVMKDAWKEKDIENAEELIKIIIKTYKADLFIYLNPDVPYVEDGQRWNSDLAVREKLNKELKDLYAEFGITVLEVSGTSYQERMKTLIDIIQEKLEISI